MKKLFLFMAVLSITGCAAGFLKAGKTEEGQKLAPSSEEFRSEKIYRILEQGGTYYIVRLTAPGLLPPEKVTPRAAVPGVKADTPPQTLAATPGVKAETRALDRDAPPEKKALVRIEVTKGTLPGGASSKQIRAPAEVMVGSRNLEMVEMGELSKEINVSSEGVKRDSLMTGESPKKEASSVLPSQPGRVENRPKSTEDLSPRSARREVTVFFPLGRAFISKGSPEYNRLSSFAANLSREAQGKKLFLAVIGSASAIGKSDFNQRLSRNRAEFIRKVLDGLLVDVSHEFFKVYGLGDSLSPKTDDRLTNEKYQSVQVIAAYNIKELPELPGIKN